MWYQDMLFDNLLVCDDEVRCLDDHVVKRITTKHYIVAVRHVMQSDEPQVRQTSVNPLAVVISQKRVDTFIEYLRKFEVGFHRHSVVIGR